jgi:hypothetical protein
MEGFPKYLSQESLISWESKVILGVAIRSKKAHLKVIAITGKYQI